MEKWPELHTSRLTIARASEKVGRALAYQAVVRPTADSDFSRVWAIIGTSE